MPHVKSQSQVSRSGQHNKSDINAKTPESKARDNINTAFAGDENKGPAKSQKSGHNGSHLKSRRLDQDSDKTPKR